MSCQADLLTRVSCRVRLVRIGASLVVLTHDCVAVLAASPLWPIGTPVVGGRSCRRGHQLQCCRLVPVPVGHQRPTRVREVDGSCATVAHTSLFRDRSCATRHAPAGHCSSHVFVLFIALQHSLSLLASNQDVLPGRCMHRETEGGRTLVRLVATLCS